MGFLKLFFLTNLLLLLPIGLHCANTYNVGDPVPFFVNKIGPLRNPSETYQYYELAFCRPDKVIEKKESLGEVLNGDRLTNSLYELEFAVNKTGAVLCQKKLNKGDVAKFRDAIVNEFYYQMYYDDLPLWAFIGKVEDASWSADVFLLMGLLTVLFMRHLKNDLRKWSIGDEDEEKEVGWKYIHGDVFRSPTNVPLFSAVLGCGTQLLIMSCWL